MCNRKCHSNIDLLLLEMNVSFYRFSKNDLIGTVIVQLKDADLYGVLMKREIDQTKGLLKVKYTCNIYSQMTYKRIT